MKRQSALLMCYGGRVLKVADFRAIVLSLLVLGSLGALGSCSIDLTPPASADDVEFTWLNPLPHGGSAVSVAADGAGLVVAVGNEVPVQSRDDGRTWTIVPGDPGGGFRDVVFAEPGRAIAVGYDGRVSRTLAWTGAWVRVAPVVASDLYRVAASDDGLVCAVGAAGACIRSTDGGANWEIMAVPDKGLLQGVACPGQGVVLVVGEKGRVHRSEDGGIHWTTQSMPGGEELLNVDVCSGGQGLAVGAAGGVWVTRDFGQTWIPAEVEVNGPIWGALALAGRGLYFGTAHGEMYGAAISGTGWRSLGTLQDGSAHSLAWSSGALWGAGTSVVRRELPDGAWQTVRPFTRERFTAVDFAQERGGVAVTDSGHVYLWPDTDREWLRVEETLSGGLTGVALFGVDGVLATGTEGNIWQSRDGGRTWQGTSLTPGKELLCVAAPDDSTAYVFGRLGAGFVTRNGGVAWEPISALGPSEIRGVDFSDTMTGRIVGGLGLRMDTRDGRTWWPMAYFTSRRLNDVAFPTQEIGLVVGSSSTGHIWRTSDGGESWTETPVKGGPLYSISMRQDGSGLVTGFGGLVLVTDDYGLTWERLASGVPNSLQACAITGPDSAILVGTNLAILQMTGVNRPE